MTTRSIHVTGQDMQRLRHALGRMANASAWDQEHLATNRVSVLAPLGTALLGYRQGDLIEWPMPGGVRQLRVEKILHQPEVMREATHAT